MATILEGLNAISQAVGGAGEAESNLEALNQISGALGGSADAENNADAIANIAENASGGGGAALDGRVNFSIARTNDPSGVIRIPCVFVEKEYDPDAPDANEWSGENIGDMPLEIGPHSMMREMCVPLLVSLQGTYLEGAFAYTLISPQGNAKITNITSAEGSVRFDTAKGMVRFKSNSKMKSMNITFAVDGAAS